MAHALLEGGTATVAELADRLDLTGAAVRRHLDELVDAGLVGCGDRPAFGPDTRRKGRGRPARYYHLTQAGRDSFGTSYQEVALDALRFLAETAGPEAVMALAQRRLVPVESHYAALLDGVQTSQERVELLADALSAAGYAAAVVPTGTGFQLCQHNCPVAHVATQFPEFCEAEAEVFGRLLGTHVTRLATLAHGDGVCTTLVPAFIDRAPASQDVASPVAASRGRTTT